jgi:hypothetical protein
MLPIVKPVPLIKSSAHSRLLARLPLVICALLLQSGCSLFGIRSAEAAPYSVLEEQGQYQIRQYQSLLVATTIVDSDFDEAGKQAFRRLFNYISGDNRADREIAMTAPVLATENAVTDGEKIEMTAPVISEKQDRGWRFSFVLPAGYTLENSPLPNDERVSLQQIPARKVASLQYSGSWQQERFDTNSELLLQWIREQQLQPDSLPRVAGYDPPWTLPFLRRNEVLVDIKP